MKIGVADFPAFAFRTITIAGGLLVYLERQGPRLVLALVAAATLLSDRAKAAVIKSQPGTAPSARR